MTEIRSWILCRTGSMRKNRGTAEDFDSFRWIIILFYKTDDETEIVYVIIMYGGRDVHKQLSQTEDVSSKLKQNMEQKHEQLVYENRLAAFLCVWDMHVKM